MPEPLNAPLVPPVMLISVASKSVTFSLKVKVKVTLRSETVKVWPARSLVIETVGSTVSPPPPPPPSPSQLGTTLETDSSTKLSASFPVGSCRGLRVFVYETVMTSSPQSMSLLASMVSLTVSTSIAIDSMTREVPELTTNWPGANRAGAGSNKVSS